MNDNPNSQDFDWVTARERCSLENEFSLLKSLVKQNCGTKKSFLRKDHVVIFSFTEDSEREFFVTREPKNDTVGKSYTVLFGLRNEHIHIISQWGDLAEFEIVVELNDNGECCFRIVGEDGEYLRWQIVRRVLSPLFFDGPKKVPVA